MSGIGICSRRFFGDQVLRFVWRDAEVEDQIFLGQAIDAVFEVLDPGEEFFAVFRGAAGGLMGEIRAHVAVAENNSSISQRGKDGMARFEAVAGVQQSGYARIEGIQWAKIAIEKLANHFSKHGAVLRESGGQNALAARFEFGGQQTHLSLLAAAIDALYGDQYSGR